MARCQSLFRFQLRLGAMRRSRWQSGCAWAESEPASVFNLCGPLLSGLPALSAVRGDPAAGLAGVPGERGSGWVGRAECEADVAYGRWAAVCVLRVSRPGDMLSRLLLSLAFDALLIGLRPSGVGVSGRPSVSGRRGEGGEERRISIYI